MARLIPIFDVSGGGAVDPRQAESQLEQLVREQGARVLHVFWAHALSALPASEGVLHLILLFETRSQFPAYRQTSTSFEQYVHEPEMTESGTPTSLDPADMAAAVCNEISKTGQYVVSTVERWKRSDDFVPMEHVDRGNAAEDWLVCVEVSSGGDGGS